MSFHATDAGFSARTIRLSTFRKHLMSSVCAGLIIVAAGSGALAQQVPGRYFNADGSKTNDYEAAKKSWLDDKEFNGNWGLKALNADAAYAQGINGTGSKVGVIDQPVWAAHREFAGADKLKFITTQGIRTYTDPYLPVKAGEPFIYDGRIYIDGDKGIAHHGTHVAGIAAGNRNGLVATSVNRVVSDSDHENFRPAVFGMQGVAYGAKIIASDNGDPGPEDGIVLGNDGGVYAAAWQAMIDNHADVITNSWGIGIEKGKGWRFLQAASQFTEIQKILGKPEGGAYDGAIKAARSGIAVEFSAGNDSGADPDAMAGLATFVPDIEKNWITTMSVVKDGKNPDNFIKSNFSSICGYAKYYCVAAPGTDILSSVPDGDITNKQKGDILKPEELIEAYASFNGTSMAGPFETGAFAVLKQRYTDLSNGEINEILKTTATDLGEKGVDAVYGWGLINIDKALKGPGQFLGRFNVNLGAGVSDRWSNDISQAALDQRKREESDETADWAKRKSAGGWSGPPTDSQLRTAVVPQVNSAPALLQSLENAAPSGNVTKEFDAITKNDIAQAALSRFLQQTVKAEGLRDSTYGQLLRWLPDEDEYTTKVRTAFTNGIAKFLDPATFAILDSDIAEGKKALQFEYAFMENTRVPYLTKKLSDPSAYLGGLTKSGAKSLWLTGKNTYRGDTIVNGGELGIGAEGSIISASIINNTGLLTVDGKTAAVTANPGGRLKVNTPGVTGAVTLNGGFASVDGTSGATEVNASGELGGIGTVDSLAVHAGGMVSPGNSIGTLHVAGPATFDKATGLTIQVAADGRSDRLEVKGKATLLGGVLIVAPENSKTPLSPAETLALLGKTYTVLTAEKGVSGRFEAATPDYYFIGASLAYAPGDVKVSLGRNGVAFADAGQTKNQKAAATGVESLGRGNPLYDTIAVTTLGENLPEHFDALSGEVHASLQAVLVEDSRFVRDAAANRIRAAFGNMAGGKTSAAALAYGPDAKKGSKAAGEAFVPLLPAVPTTAFWGEAYGSRSHADGTSNASAYSRNTGGFVTGFDGVIADTWRFGLLAGYGNTSVNTARGHASADSYQVGVYGGTRLDALTLSLGTSLAHHQIDTRRKALGDSNTADYSANTVQLFGEAAYRIDTAYAALEPFAAAAYTHLKTDAFTETGGKTALSGQSDTTDLTTTTLGLRASHRFVLSEATALTARGMAGWRHAFGDTTPEASLAFASGGQAFPVHGLPIASDTALVEAGLDFGIGKATTLGLSYTGQFSQQTRDNAVKANVTTRF